LAVLLVFLLAKRPPPKLLRLPPPSALEAEEGPSMTMPTPPAALAAA
jgi:hypothetical protein